jgi:hypothetical protein
MTRHAATVDPCVDRSPNQESASQKQMTHHRYNQPIHPFPNSVEPQSRRRDALYRQIAISHAARMTTKRTDEITITVATMVPSAVPHGCIDCGQQGPGNNLATWARPPVTPELTRLRIQLGPA